MCVEKSWAVLSDCFCKVKVDEVIFMNFVRKLRFFPANNLQSILWYTIKNYINFLICKRSLPTNYNANTTSAYFTGLLEN